MSSVRSVLCGSRTILRSKQLSVVVMMRNISSTNTQQSFDLSCINNNNKRQLLSNKSVFYTNKSKYTTALSNMTKDQANELVFRLNDSERQILLQVLNQFESNKERKRLEGNQRVFISGIYIIFASYSCCSKLNTHTKHWKTTTIKE